MHALAVPPAAPAQRTLEDRILESLELAAHRVTALEPGRWQLTRAGEQRARTTVAIDGDWLVVECALPGFTLTRLALTRRWGGRALDARLALPEGVRPVLAAGGLRVSIRGERPLIREQSDDWEHLDAWIHAALAAGAAFKSGARDRRRANPDAEPASAACEGADVDIAALCEQAGWPVTPRAESTDVVVALPARDGAMFHAIVGRAGDGIRLRVALAALGSASPPCQAAATLALLRTAASARMVRASATRSEKGFDSALEIRLAPAISAPLLNHALSALVVAQQQVSKELAVLGSDDALARAYLSVQGVH